MSFLITNGMLQCYCKFCHCKTDMYKRLRFQSLEVHKAPEANALYNMLVKLTVHIECLEHSKSRSAMTSFVLFDENFCLLIQFILRKTREN